MPKPQERAELIVNGVVFHDWKTVMVEHRFQEGYHVFDFTCTEKGPQPPDWKALQFKPGDLVTIKLAGIIALIGFITHREVAYDANNHSVRLIGKSFTSDPARSSIKTGTGNFDGYSFSAIARSLLAPFGCGLETIGAVDETPFKRCQVLPGEKVFAFLSKLAAHRDISLGAAIDTRNLVAVGSHSATIWNVLEEGTNILRANCEISNEYVYEQYFGIGQQAGDEQENGDTVSKQMCVVGGSYGRYAPCIAPTELAGSMYDVQRRTQFEARWREGTFINAQITVQGWLSPSGDLWRILTYPLVRSPMLMLDQPLGIKRSRFTQGPDGTLTLLELVAPWHLHGVVSWSGTDVFPRSPGAPTQIR
jgi:prophage tail gpP-like protein